MVDAPRLTRELSADDPEVRRRAVVALAGPDFPERADLLLLGLRDDNWRVRKEAVGVARGLAGDGKLRQRLVETFGPGETDVGLRNAAVEALAAFGEGAVETLAAALPALDADGKKLAAEVLGATGVPSALMLLGALVEDGDPNVRAAAAEAVAAIGLSGLEAAVPLLRRCLDAEDMILRMTALNGLNDLGVVLPWEAVEPLLTDPILRGAALRAAGRGAEAAAAPVLVDELGRARLSRWRDALASLVDYVRAGDDAVIRARRALQALPAAARTLLLERACGPGPRQRDAIIVAGVLGGVDAARAAVTALRDEQYAAAGEEALTFLGAEAVPALVESLQDGSAQERAHTVELIGVLIAQAPGASPRRAVAADALVGVLEDGPPEVVRAAMGALARIGDERAFVAIATHPSTEVRVRRAAAGAIRGLAERYPEVARATAAEATATGPDALAAVVATGVLHRLPGGGGGPVREHREADVDFLSAVLSTDGLMERRFALEALAAIGGDEALSAVAFALTDEEEEVRLAAIDALGVIEDATGRRSGGGALRQFVDSAESPAQVAAAVRALAATGHPDTESVLRRLLQGDDVLLSVSAVEALGVVDAEARVGMLSLALRHGDAEVVKAALQLLVGQEGPIGALLAGCLEHPAWDVRRLASDLIGERRERAVAPSLRARLSSEPEPLVREAIQRALVEVEGLPVRRTTPVPARDPDDGGAPTR